MTKTTIRPTGFLFLFCIPAVALAWYDEIARSRYRADSDWPQSPSVPGVVENWTPMLGGVPGDGVEVGTNRIDSSENTALLLDWTDRAGAAFDLRTCVCPDFPSAKTELLRKLGMMQSTATMPAGTNGLDRLGDICLARIGDPVRVFFVRNNVVVSLWTDADGAAATNLLFNLDAQIVDALENP